MEELDLLLLATVAAGYARFAGRPSQRPPALSPRGRAVAWGLAAISALGLVRGVADAGGWDFGWFQGYVEPINSLRVAKSAIHALLLVPLLRGPWLADRERAFRCFALGMLAGATAVTAAVLWERTAFPGLFDVSAPYRTVAMFWEMHVGGAAIDAYVVLCTPFVAWSLWAARTRGLWLAAALFAVLWGYACLTTFSRGAYLGAAIALLVLGLQLPVVQGARWWPAARAVAFVMGAAVLLALVLDSWGYGAALLALLASGAALWLRWRGHATRRHRTLAVGWLTLALIFEAVVIAGPDSFMSSRMAKSALDYESRTGHWRRGLGLLDGAGDWLWGLGLGRLPAHYDRFAPRGAFSGSVQLQGASSDTAYVRIAGPRLSARLGGLHGLTQRVPPAEAYRLRFDLRAGRGAVVLARVCEAHLLYDRECQTATAQVGASSEIQWQPMELVLQGPPLHVGRWYAPRQAVLTLSVLNRGGSAEFDHIALEGPEGRPLLQNGDFAAGLAHWLPSAQLYFLPWHIDNLYLELLIEQGVAGLLLWLGLAAAVVWRLVRRADAGDPAAPFIAASLCGVLSVGLVSSVLDVPRVALLVGLLLALGALQDGVRPAAMSPPEPL